MDHSATLSENHTGLVENIVPPHWAGIPEVVGLFLTVVGQSFQTAQCGFHSE